MASNLKKYVIRKLIERAGYTPENLPISLSSSRIMEDYTRNLGPLIPGVPVQKRGESLRLELPKQKRVVSRQTDTSGNTQVIYDVDVIKTPDGKLKRNKDGNLVLKKESRKKKPKPKQQSPLEKRIEQEKILDNILKNPDATKKFQHTESSPDDVIDINTGMDIETARKTLADVPEEIGSGSSLVKRIKDLSPTTIERSNLVNSKDPEVKKILNLMNKVEESELKGTDIDSISKKSIGKGSTQEVKKAAIYFDEQGLPLVPSRKIKLEIKRRIDRITNQEDRNNLRDLFQEEFGISKGKPPAKIRPTSRTKVNRDTGEVTVTKGTTTRDPAVEIPEIDRSPNIVGQASDPRSPVVKLKIDADPGLDPKTDQEFFSDRVQNYIDQGDDLDTARIRARDDIGERDLSKDYTGEQLRELLGEGVLETDRGGLRDEATEMLEQQMRALIPKEKKKGGQIKKPVKNKRKIKTSVRGNDLVAMMYD